MKASTLDSSFFDTAVNLPKNSKVVDEDFEAMDDNGLDSLKGIVVLGGISVLLYIGLAFWFIF